MDGGRRSRPRPPVPAESNAASTRRSHRALLNDARRKVERALAAAEAADDLAEAAEAVLTAAAAEQIDLDGLGVVALRAALARYRQARGL